VEACLLDMTALRRFCVRKPAGWSRAFASSADDFLRQGQYGHAVDYAERTFPDFPTADQEGRRQWHSFAKSVLDNQGGMRRMYDYQIVSKSLARANYDAAAFWTKFVAKGMTVIGDTRIEDNNMESLVDVAGAIARVRLKDIGFFTVFVERARSAMHNDEEMPPGRVAQFASVISSVKLRDPQAYFAVGQRVIEDPASFSTDDLIRIMASLGNVDYQFEELTRTIGRHLHPQVLELPHEQRVELAFAYGHIGIRHDTFFKTIVKDLLSAYDEYQKGVAIGAREEDLSALRERLYSVRSMALIVDAMITLKMYRERTAWWDKKADFLQLAAMIESQCDDDVVAKMDGRDLAAVAHCMHFSKRYDPGLVRRMVNRYKVLLDGSILDGEQEWLSKFFTHISLTGVRKRKQDLVLQPYAQWLCKNATALELSEVCNLLRRMADLGFDNHEFYKAFIPFFYDNMQELGMADVGCIVDSFNKVKLHNDVMGDRFFYKLGLHFQDQVVLKSGETSKKVQRIG